MQEYKTDKIGFAAYLMMRNHSLIRAEVKNRNRATFVFDMGLAAVRAEEQSFLCSEFSRYFEAFKHLREMTIRGG